MLDPTIIQAPSILGAFFGGLLGTLAPCVYPLIPITLSIVGAGKEASRLMAVFRSSLYCLGIFSCYTFLGIFAVFSGSFFGEFWSSQIFRSVLGIVLCLYALISLDLIFLRSDGAISQKAAKLGGNSSFGAFAAGAMSAVLAAPCTGALLAAILTLAASNPDKTTGIMLLIAYAAGFSLPFFALSLSPRIFKIMPRSGSWLYGAKILIGSSLLALGFYYLFASYFQSAALGLGQYYQSSFLVGVVLLLISLKIGVRSYLNEQKLLRFISAFLAALIVTYFSINFLNRNNLQTANLPILAEQLKIAKEKDSLVLLEFSADWCVKCKELSQILFTNDQIKTALSEISTVVIDLSEISSEEKELQQYYAVRGLPSILFLCPSGKELAVPRVSDVIDPAQFIKMLELAKTEFTNCKQR